MYTTTDLPVPASADTRDLAGSPRPALMVAFYLGVPLCVAIVMAWNPTGSRAPRMEGPFLPAAYWLGLLLPLWALLHLGAVALKRAFGAVRVRPPLLVLLFASAAVATLLFRPYLIHYWALVDRLLDPANAPAYSALPPLWPQSLNEFLSTLQRAGFLFAVWAAVNLFYVHALGVPRYGYGIPAATAAARDADVATVRAAAAAGPHAAGAAQPPDTRRTPAFLERLPRDLGGELIALQAQDHYLRVTTRAGSALVLYRFSDALRDMEGTAGIRVHRSHWVARSAVQRLVARGGRHSLLLTNGERIPVSRTYLDRVRQQLH